MCERREFIAETEFVCSIPGCSKREAIILFLHLFVQYNAIRIFQPAVNIVMASSNHLELERALRALGDLLVEALLGVVGQLEGDLGGPRGAGQRQQQQQRQPPPRPLGLAAPRQHGTARGGRARQDGDRVGRGAGGCGEAAAARAEPAGERAAERNKG